MLKGKNLYRFLCIYFIFLMIPAYWLPLFETTDARYGEIAREMLASGNFMEPYYNGIKHFHKPPLPYWLNALGMSIFGINGFGVRFFGAVSAVLILFVTKKLAYLLSDNEEAAENTVLILASSALFLIVSRVVSTDIYLALFTVLSLYHMFKQIYVKRTVTNALLIGLYLGLGFMCKGPVIFIFTLAPLVVALFMDGAHREMFTPAHLLVCIAVFAAVSLPWYAYVVSINEGLLNYFLQDQTVDRVSTNKFARSKPFYYFPTVFFITFFPWVFYFFKNWQLAEKLKTGKVIYLYILVPFIVFQISASKLGTYLLPFFPMAAVAAAVSLESKFVKHISAALLVLLGIVACALPFILDYTEPFKVYLILFGSIYFISALLAAVRGYLYRNFTYLFGVFVIIFTLAVYSFIPFIESNIKGYRAISNEIKEYNAGKNLEVLIYRTFTPSISFYLNDVKAIAFNRKRETQFQKYDEYKGYLIETVGELQDYLSDKEELLVVTRDESHKAFERDSGYECEVVIFRGGNKKVSHCKSR